MEVLIYHNFSKKENSTKRPSGATTLNAVLKDGSSILNPVFILNRVEYGINYIQWGSRYYFVNDIIAIANGLAEYHCAVDVLASYRNEIGSASLYVTRSSYTKDGRIMDSMYPTTNQVSGNADFEETIWKHNLNQGFYIVAISGQGANSTSGGTSYYKMTPEQFTSFCNYMYSDSPSYLSNLNAVLEYISIDLYKSLYNPFQYVKSVKWFPCAPGDLIATGTNAYKFGWWEKLDSEAAVLDSNTIITKTVNLNIPKHPQASERGVYMNCAPFTEYSLVFYPFGVIDIDTTKISDCSKLKCSIEIDCISGKGILTITAKPSDAAVTETDRLLAVRYANIGINIQLSSLNVNAPAVISTGTNAASAVVSAIENRPSGVVAGIESAVIGSASASIPVLQTVGENDGIAGLEKSHALYARFLHAANDDNKDMGRPLMRKVTLNTIPGYIKCQEADIDISCTETERNEIKNYLTSGFFYE